MPPRPRKKSQPQRQLLTEQTVDALLRKLQAQGKQPFSGDDYDALLGVVQTWAHLTEVAARPGSDMREVRRILGMSAARERPTTATSDSESNADDSAKKENDTSLATREESDGALDPSTTSDGDEKDSNPAANRDPHGRRRADAFEHMEAAHHAHVSLHTGDTCPACVRGRLYKYRPGEFTTISGRAPLVATRHTVESLQCNMCDEVYRAPLPAALDADGVSGRVLYSYSAVAVVCIQRCFGGMPMHRQDRIQRSLGVHVPDASMWDMHERLANALRPVRRHLVMQAAHASVFFGDDTGATILESRSQVRANRKTGKLVRRTGCHTTGVVALLQEQEQERTVVIFQTGIHHTGEVMDLILEKRDPQLPAPIFMGDGIASNTVTTTLVMYAGCNAHAVRKFKELADKYPEHTAYVLQRYRQIFKNDKTCAEQEMSPEQRRDYHKEHSRHLLREITEYGEDLIERHEIEPNGDIGDAFEYVIGNERRLAAFTRYPQAPIDNNRVERTLRTSVRLRETTHFFRNAAGAGIADTILTVGATAMASRVNLFDYFIALQRHADDVRDDPARWVPWRYQQRLQEITGVGPPKTAPPEPIMVMS